MAANKGKTETKTEEVKDKESDFEGYLSFVLFKEAVSGKDTDLTFLVGPDFVPMHAHSVVLKRTSVVLDVMLSEPWKRGQEIALPEDDPEDFRLFLKLLYGYKKLDPSDYEDAFGVIGLADKYDSVPVENALWRFASNLVNKSLTVANIIPVFQSAKVYDCKELKIMKFIKNCTESFILDNINGLWKRAEWLELEEEDITWILSQDPLHHVDFEKDIPPRICNCGRSCCLSSLNPQRSTDTLKKWFASKNEVLILGKAIDWIKHQTSRKKTPDTMQVLQHIRFRQISHDDFEGVFDRLRDTLQETELAQILLAHHGVGSGLSGFGSLEKPRGLPEYEQERCRCCRKYTVCRIEGLGCICATCYSTREAGRASSKGST